MAGATGGRARSESPSTDRGSTYGEQRFIGGGLRRHPDSCRVKITERECALAGRRKSDQAVNCRRFAIHQGWLRWMVARHELASLVGSRANLRGAD